MNPFPNVTPMDPERVVGALTRAGLPIPPGHLTYVTVRMQYQDWYVVADQQWYWWSGREWKLCPNGPL